jgi:ribosomal protein S18 acetylase RimI-like enzyme
MNGRQPLRVRRDTIEVDPLSADDTETCRQVEMFLGASVALYPEIDQWWRRRVLPGLRRRERVVYTAIDEGRLLGVCIGKIDLRSTKLCTLRVDDEVQHLGLGSRLLRRLLCDVAGVGGRQVHFTISESIDQSCGSYFRGLGFSRRALLRRPKREAGDELVYSLAMKNLRTR